MLSPALRPTGLESPPDAPAEPFAAAAPDDPAPDNDNAATPEAESANSDIATQEASEGHLDPSNTGTPEPDENPATGLPVADSEENAEQN